MLHSKGSHTRIWMVYAESQSALELRQDLQLCVCVCVCVCVHVYTSACERMYITTPFGVQYNLRHTTAVT